MEEKIKSTPRCKLNLKSTQNVEQGQALQCNQFWGEKFPKAFFPTTILPLPHQSFQMEGK